MTLMGHHYRGLYVAVCFLCVGFNCLDLRKRLKTLFTNEGRKLFLKFAKGRRRMPDLPVMKIAHLLRLVVVLEIGAWRTGPVRTRRIQGVANLRQHTIKKFLVIVPK